MMVRASDADVEPLARSLAGLGVTSREVLHLLLDRMQIHSFEAKEGIRFQKQASIVLLTGIACSQRVREDGTRDIVSFHLPGDFCNLHPSSPSDDVDLMPHQPVTVGVIGAEALEQLVERHAAVRLALWRVVLLNLSIAREWMLRLRRPALERVAHLMCELLTRRQAIGESGDTIPLTQIDLADATGLSTVHLNRTFQKLRAMEILSSNSPGIEVIDRKRLVALCNFDGRYLNTSWIASRWTIGST